MFNNIKIPSIKAFLTLKRKLKMKQILSIICSFVILASISGVAYADMAPTPTLQSIVVTTPLNKPNKITNLGFNSTFNQQLVAQGLYSDGSSQDITSQVTWASTNSLVAEVNPTTGYLSVTTAGTAIVSATLNGINGTLNVIYNPKMLSNQSQVAVFPSISSQICSSVGQKITINTQFVNDYSAKFYGYLPDSHPGAIFNLYSGYGNGLAATSTNNKFKCISTTGGPNGIYVSADTYTSNVTPNTFVVQDGN